MQVKTEQDCWCWMVTMGLVCNINETNIKNKFKIYS